MLTVAPASLDWALAHTLLRGDTDIFPLPFEYTAIEMDWETIRNYLSGQDLDRWTVRPLRQYLSPKHGLGFRIATQLDPLDALIFLALVYEVGQRFEAARVPAHENSVHSHRFAPTDAGRLFSPLYNYESFRNASIDRALSAQTKFVVLTDIADFYPRIYLHPLENAMEQAAPHSGYARVFRKLISGWNQGVSHGIPVGPAPSRLLADLTVNDVDQALLAKDYDFIRFSDDYRVFVSSERMGREALAFLAHLLFQNHGLTLNEGKTEIISAADFVRRFERAERDHVRHRLQEEFSALIDQLGLSGGDYEPVDYEDLTEEQRDLVNSLNLWSILEGEVRESRALDITLTRFVLGRIRQLGLIDESRLLERNIARLYPVFSEVVAALVAPTSFTESERAELGARLLALFDHSIVGHLEFHREWLLSPFATDGSWNHSNRLVRLYDRYSDQFTRRAIVLALGTAGAAHWFRPRKQEIAHMPIWERRAFLLGAACLPGDEARHWYSSLRPSLDILERSVVKYAQTSIPF